MGNGAAPDYFDACTIAMIPALTAGGSVDHKATTTTSSG
jgi:hypothetical protein